MPLVLVGVVFVPLQVLSPIHQAIGANLGSRTAAWLYDRLTSACVRPPGMGHLENPEAHERPDDGAGLRPGHHRAADVDLDGLHRRRDWWRWWRVWPRPPCSSASPGGPRLLLAGAWLATHWLLRESGVWRDRNTEEVREAQRHADYAYRLAVEPPAAKELRLFGLADWVVERFRSRRRRLFELRWQATRLRERPVVWSVLLVLAANHRGVLVDGDRRGRRRARARSGGDLRDRRRDDQHDRLRRAVVGARRCRRARRGGASPRGRRWARPGRWSAAPGRPPGMPAREIRFRNVTFAYPTTGEPVLEGFDLTIPAGSSLAIVGQNGAGKTTLAKLLCRLYDPQAGAIEIDGVDLRELDLDAWRSRVAAVFQDFIRFELPLRDNVAPAGAPDEVIRAALADAGAAGLAELDTVLARGYEGGTELSGGQWQRVALARALCAVRLGAGVVLLDEPTAQLDVRGEAEIFDRILAATRHTTTILISHRFSTVRHADRICVLEGGRVVELGTHDELMAAGGRYRTMFDLQASRFGSTGDGRGRGGATMSSRDDLPPALPAMWRALKRGYQAEPRLLLGGVRLLAAGGVARRAPGALAQAACRRRAGARPRARDGGGGGPGRVGHRDLVPARGQRSHPAPVSRPGDHRARIARGPAAGVGGHDRASRAPRVPEPAGDAARPGVRARSHVHVAVFHVRLDPAAGRDRGAADVDSPGARAARRVCAADGAHLRLAAGRGARRRGTRRAGESAGAAPVRDGHDGAARQGGARDRHRRTPGGRAPRGVGTLVRPGGRGALGECPAGTRWRGRSSAPGSSARWRSSRWWLDATPGNVLLVLAAGSRLSAYIGATVGEIGFLRGIWLDGSRRLAWLEDYAAALAEHSDAPVPERLASGIRFEHVSFAYPGTERRVLEDVCLDLKPGSVVAIVGENGAGKTTLVKLLCRLYQPTSGRILVDGLELARMPVDAWRSRLAGAFQDFFRFEFRARHTVGVGDVPRLDDEPAVAAAVERAGATDVVDRTGGRARDAARPDLARRRGGQLRPVAEARPGPRLHARSSAAPGAR